jgi:hypothetical protein
MPRKSSTWISGSLAAEEALQRRSQSRVPLNVLTLYVSASALLAALCGKGRVLARLGWAGVLEVFLSSQHVVASQLPRQEEEGDGENQVHSHEHDAFHPVRLSIHRDEPDDQH